MKEVTHEKIVTIVNTQIENDKITSKHYNDNIQEFGIDSLKFIRIIVALEEEYNCEIPDTRLLFSEMNTIEKIYRVLSKEAIQLEER